MMAHSKAVTHKKGNKMVTYYIRGSRVWLNYYVDGVRKQRSTGLENTPLNIKIVTGEMIPALNIEIATGNIHKKKPKTFGYYGSIFLREKTKLKSYHSKLSKWGRVIEFFKNREIDTISRLDIKVYLNGLDIKSSSKHPYRSCLNEIFELAVDDRVISSNPALNIKLPREEKEPIRYYSKEEVHKLLDVATDFFRVYLLIAFHTGLRSGEILGLQLGDFEDKYISVKRTRSKGVIGNGKTVNSIRKVPYPSFILDEVRKIQSRNIFIFEEIDDSGKLDYIWRKCTKLANVPKLRLYCTRHTYATLMLQSRVVSINELSGLLGHASVQTTLNKYASVIKAEMVHIDPNFSLYCDNTVTTNNVNELKAL